MHVLWTNTRNVILNDQNKVMPVDMFYTQLTFPVPRWSNPIWGSTRLIISPSKSYY